jgi:hypothetical protein
MTPSFLCWVYSSLISHFPSMYKVLGSVSSTAKEEGKEEEEIEVKRK